MSNIDRNLFELYEIDEALKESFMGSGFIVKKGGKPVFTTADHVAFDGNTPRKLRAKSHDGTLQIDQLTFNKRPDMLDIAEAEITHLDGVEGLDLGSDADLVQGNISIRSSRYHGILKGHSSLNLTEIGGINPEKWKQNGSKKIDRDRINHFGYTGNGVINPVGPGDSGQAILVEDGEKVKVVGVHRRGGWKAGIKHGLAVIYTSDNKE